MAADIQLFLSVCMHEVIVLVLWVGSTSNFCVCVLCSVWYRWIESMGIQGNSVDSAVQYVRVFVENRVRGDILFIVINHFGATID